MWSPFVLLPENNLKDMIAIESARARELKLRRGDKRQISDSVDKLIELKTALDAIQRDPREDLSLRSQRIWTNVSQSLAFIDKAFAQKRFQSRGECENQLKIVRTWIDVCRMEAQKNPSFYETVSLLFDTATAKVNECLQHVSEDTSSCTELCNDIQNTINDIHNVVIF